MAYSFGAHLVDRLNHLSALCRNDQPNHLTRLQNVNELCNTKTVVDIPSGCSFVMDLDDNEGYETMVVAEGYIRDLTTCPTERELT